MTLGSVFSPAGMIDSCVEQMKHVLAQLQLQSVRPGKANRKKVSRAWMEISSRPVLIPFMHFYLYKSLSVTFKFKL